MRALLDRLRRDPGLALLLFALVAAAALYAPTLGRGMINYDDPWLIQNNFILAHPSAANVHRVVFDTGRDTRFVLGAEYLPVRDLSVMLDRLVWGTWYPGYHLTNLVLYLACLALWFAALVELGVDRTLAGVAILLWAIHPSHAESVAWLSERKGLLGLAFAGLSALGHARYRAGRRGGWLALAMAAAVGAVWSKALAAFAVAALAGLEGALPARRRSWRRSLAGLGAIALVGIAAFVPVVIVATRMEVVGAGAAPAGWLAMVLGLHGFYLELAAMAVPNSIAYPIRTLGPSALQLGLGAVGLVAALGVALVPARGRWRPPAALCAASWIWLAGWFPASRIALPLRAGLVSDRYVLFGTLGVALAIAVGLAHIPTRRARHALLAALAIAAGLRTLDAQANWRDAVTLWQRATASDPADGDAWASYAEAVQDAGDPELAGEILMRGLRHSRSRRLVFREALFALDHGSRARAMQLLEQAARAGEPHAMADLALLLSQDGKQDEALAWARRAVGDAPDYAKGYQILGKIALAANRAPEALRAFRETLALSPQDPANHYNLALALIQVHRLDGPDSLPAGRAAPGRRGLVDEARAQLAACVDAPGIGAQCRAQLAALPAR